MKKYNQLSIRDGKFLVRHLTTNATTKFDMTSENLIYILMNTVTKDPDYSLRWIKSNIPELLTQDVELAFKLIT